MAGSSNRLSRWLNRQRFDIIGAVIGLLLAVAMLPLRLIASNILIISIPTIVGIASGLYLFSVRADYSEGLPTIPIWLGRLLPSTVLLGTTLLIGVGLWQGGRTPLFYNIATLVGIAIFAQIFFIRERDFVPWLLLLQIIAFAFTLRFIGLLTTPGYIGIDIWTHVASWAVRILETHSLQPLVGNKYYVAALFHLLTVTTSLLAGVPIRGGLFLSVGIAMAFCVLFIYLTARLFVSERWSLFALAIFSISAHPMEWGLHLIPTSLGLAFFLGVIFLLSWTLSTNPSRRIFVLIVVFSIATILTHQISAFIMLILTGAGLVAHLLLRLSVFAPPSQTHGVTPTTNNSVSLTGLLAFDLGFITFTWSLTPYHGNTFLATTFSFFRTALTQSSGLGDLAGPSSPVYYGPELIKQLVTYINVAVFLSVFLLTVIGCLYILRRRNISHATLMYGITVVVMLVFILGLPMFGVRTFVPQRWYGFLTAPMALLAAIGIAYLARNLQPPTIMVVLLVFMIVFPTVSIAASEATLDNPRFEQVQTKYSYTEPELNAVETIGDIRPLNQSQQYHTDHPYNTVFSRAGPGTAVATNISSKSLANSEVVIYRDYQTTGAAYFVGQNGSSITPEMTRSKLCGADRHYAYANGNVTMCTASWEVNISTNTGNNIGGSANTG